jgi:two-component system, sensor histidine kinase and response regulator
MIPGSKVGDFHGEMSHADSNGKMSHAVREEVLLSLVRNSMDAIVSADGVIDYWNPAAERLYGYTAEEAIGKPATLIVPPDKLDEFERMKEKLERGERIEQFVTQRLRKDGTLVEVEITVFPVMDGAGKLAATSVISHDMIENRRLQKELEQTVKLKTDFLAKMSHEIRTPLNAIIGTAELQMLSDMTPEQRRRMGIIESSGELLLTIVDDILDFSKLTAGKLVLEKVDFNFVGLIEGVVDTLGAMVRSKELELAFYLDPDITSGLRGDPNRLRQILNNLLSNAIKFTSLGEVLLRVTRVDETPEDVLVHFEVKDTGIGITPDVQSHLFQPFVQAEQSTSRRFGGTGLGLVISAQLVEQMGGTIQVDSELGEGSNFHFKLRFEKGEHIPLRALSTAVAFTEIHALVVGDGAVSRGVISQYLASWGIQNVSIATEESALSELRSAPKQSLHYAVVLLDQGLGNKGLSLARIIKSDSLLKNTKVIIMSSEARSEGSIDTVDCWLTKPIRPSLLFNSLHELFLPSDRGNGDFVDSSTVRISRHAWRKDVRVLVVEDNLTNQILIKEQLGVLGYTVRIVDNASLALEILTQKEHDIVLMDCELPGLNGYEATAELRRREGNGRHIKVVALTADATENQRKRCLDAGMNDCLIKPVKLQILAENLDAYSRIEGILAGNALPDRGGKGRRALDPRALAEIAQLSKATGRNVFRSLAEIFLSDLSSQVQLITAAVESSNMSQLVLVIHPLRSASAIVGAKLFSDICAKVEQHAGDGKVDQASSLARELLEAAHALPEALLEAAHDT